MPQVYNKWDPQTPLEAVYIGRPSKWGNPFSHLEGTLARFRVPSRAAAIAAYREMLLSDAELLAAARRELRGKDLVCWCAPRACHGDILLEVANS